MAPANQIVSGQATVTTAGTEVPLSATVVANCPVMIRALAANVGKVYVGNDGAGAVSSSTGFELSPGDHIVLAYVGGLNTIMVDAATNGDKVCYILMGAGA